MHTLTNKENEAGLVGLRQSMELIFNDPKSAPSFRTYCSWKQAGYFTTIKIGRRVFCDAAQVKKELQDRFTVESNGGGE